MRELFKDLRFYLLILLLVFFLAVVAPAEASGNDTEVVTGDVSVGGGTALGLAGGPGDVAIAHCRESEQRGGLTIFWQNVQLNPWCASLYYDSIGQVDTAAKIRCSIPEIKALFADSISCVAGNTVVVAPEPLLDEEHFEDEEEWHEEQMQMQQDYDERIAQLEARANRPVRREVIQQPYLSDDKKAKLQAILDEDE